MPKSPTPIQLKERLAQLFINQPDLKDAVLNDAIKPALLKHIVSFSEEDQRSIIALFAAFSLSHQTQTQWLQWLPEIAYAKKISVADILNQASIQNIYQDTKRNNPQKIQALHDVLFVLRFPMYSEMRERWETLVNEVNPDRDKIRFTPSPAFEKNKLDLTISLTDGEKAVKLFKKLSEIKPEHWSFLIHPK